MLKLFDFFDTKIEMVFQFFSQYSNPRSVIYSWGNLQKATPAKCQNQFLGFLKKTLTNLISEFQKKKFSYA